MKRSTQRRVLPALLSLCLVCSVGLSTGCAMNEPPVKLGPLEPAVRAYSSHPAVCVPTSVGNAIGGVAAYPVGLALGLVTWPILWALPDEAADGVLRTYFYTLPYLGGFATGSLFVPLGAVLEDNPCEFTSLKG